MRLAARAMALLTMASFVLASCGGGGSSAGSGSGTTTPPQVSTALYAVPAQEALTSADVQRVMAQAIEEAAARNKPAVIAVTDRVGNVLAVFQMNGAPTTLTVKTQGRSVATGDLEGLTIAGSASANPLVAAAIAKALTGAYLSSGGNAFSTRTASFIVQEHYPAGDNQLPGGPLFGVQFSQLPCSDVSARFGAAGAAALIGPKRSPLGLAADPGGFPLYKNGVVVGGIGIMADGLYSYDRNIDDVDQDDDEYIALAGTVGFDAPATITADQIQAIVQLRYSDAKVDQLKKTPSTARAFSSLNGSLGALVSVNGYYTAPTVLAGQAYGSEASGVRAAAASERSSGSAIDNADAFILTDGAGANRYPIRGGTDASDVSAPLTAAEVKAVLEEAFKIMTRARAQIRKPLDSRAQVSLSVVDTHGSILGLVRSPDAPMFGTEVAVQKARTTTFFSGSRAAADLSGDSASNGAQIAGFVPAARSFFNDPAVLTGKTAFGDRSIGNLSRPFFPDGEVGQPNAPFSRPYAQWSPFSTGLQSALILDNIVQHVGFILGASASDTRQRCTFLPDIPGKAQNRLQNGMQIFPGSVPIYRGNTLIGGIGISGDGVDQDDMISFLGLYNAGTRAGTIANAPAAIRSDQIVIAVGSGVRLRFVNCPFAPFLDTADQNVCDGK